MTEQNEATSAGPNPQKRGPGRPKKSVSASPDLSELMALLKAQAKQIEALQTNALEQGKQRFEQQEATLAPVPAATEELRPGTYVQIGVDGSGAPIVNKVSWTRDWIAKVYIPITFTPQRTMTIGPHGIPYQLTADVETTVPKIVKDIYDGALQSERNMNLATRPLSMAESSAIDERAMEQPGSKQWSRLYRLAGGGLNVHGNDSQAEVTPAEQPK